MNRSSTFTLVCAAATLWASSQSAAAATKKAVDAAMKPALAEYLKIHQSLAADKEQGVAQVAGRLEQIAARIKDREIRAAAGKLRRARGLEQMRAAFKELSKPFVVWASSAKVAGVKVVRCDMAKASWVQKEPAVRNPYYGSRMLTCGTIEHAAAAPRGHGR